MRVKDITSFTLYLIFDLFKLLIKKEVKKE